jgi:MoaA/NifB/PqqE/SkfB family radical SAM enzyme
MQHSDIINGWHFKLIRQWIILNILILAFLKFKTPGKVRKILRQLMQSRDLVFGTDRRLKYARIGGKYFISFGLPRWPSRSFNRYINNHFLKLEHPDRPLLNTLIFAVTKKCGFECEHCFEWYNLNKKETLTREDILKIINQFYALGVTMVNFSGGEPMNRMKDIIWVMQQAPADMEFWMYSNGFALTEDKAIALKNAGLTGMAISLDHHVEKKHDLFRGVSGSYRKVLESAELCNKLGIAVAFSVCVTHDLAGEMDLLSLAILANEKSVRFIQLLEPKAVGHYVGNKEALLTKEEIERVEKFYLDINFNPLFVDHPIILYHGYYNRRSGCLGSAKNFVYVDTDGNVHSCPFCQQALYSALDEDFIPNLAMHKKLGCKAFPSNFSKHNPVVKSIAMQQIQN